MMMELREMRSEADAPQPVILSEAEPPTIISNDSSSAGSIPQTSSDIETPKAPPPTPQEGSDMVDPKTSSMMVGSKTKLTIIQEEPEGER